MPSFPPSTHNLCRYAHLQLTSHCMEILLHLQHHPNLTPVYPHHRQSCIPLPCVHVCLPLVCLAPQFTDLNRPPHLAHHCNSTPLCKIFQPIHPKTLLVVLLRPHVPLEHLIVSSFPHHHPGHWPPWYPHSKPQQHPTSQTTQLNYSTPGLIHPWHFNRQLYPQSPRHFSYFFDLLLLMALPLCNHRSLSPPNSHPLVCIQPTSLSPMAGVLSFLAQYKSLWDSVTLRT